MQSGPAEFDLLMQRVRAGCPEAAREVFERYNEHVRRVVRRFLHQRLRKQYDSTDFLQSVWASFFHTPADRYTFQSPEALVGFLGRVASNKIIETIRKRIRSARYGTEKEDSLETPLNGDLKLGEVVPGSDPTPSQCAIAQENWEQLCSGLPAHHQRILELLRSGHTHAEIAAALAVTPKTVQRLVRFLRSRIESV
jgi:RNA polymerase sigma factor (sigma-70 family)